MNASLLAYSLQFGWLQHISLLWTFIMKCTVFRDSNTTASAVRPMHTVTRPNACKETNDILICQWYKVIRGCTKITKLTDGRLYIEATHEERVDVHAKRERRHCGGRPKIFRLLLLFYLSPLQCYSSRVPGLRPHIVVVVKRFRGCVTQPQTAAGTECFTR